MIPLGFIIIELITFAGHSAPPVNSDFFFSDSFFSFNSLKYEMRQSGCSPAW